MMVFAFLAFVSMNPSPAQTSDQAIDSQVHWGRRLESHQTPLTPGDILSKTEVRLLDLYFRAMSAGSAGFSCVPAAYPGGPMDPRYQRMREGLEVRRLAARQRLIDRVGIRAVEAGERRLADEQFAMAREVHVSCIPKQAARARKRLKRLLTKLEKELSART